MNSLYSPHRSAILKDCGARFSSFSCFRWSRARAIFVTRPWRNALQQIAPPKPSSTTHIYFCKIAIFHLALWLSVRQRYLPRSRFPCCKFRSGSRTRWPELYIKTNVILHFLLSHIIFIRFAISISWKVRILHLRTFWAFYNANYKVWRKFAWRQNLHFCHFQHHICEMHKIAFSGSIIFVASHAAWRCDFSRFQPL